MPDKTRKQLLGELDAAETRINELEATRAGWNRVEPRGGQTDETHFARLFKDARIINLLFNAQGELLSANPDSLRRLGFTAYQNALKKSVFESPYWTDELRGRLAAGEVLRMRVALEVDALAAGGSTAPAPAEAPAAPAVAHLESTISVIGEDVYLAQVHDITSEVQSKAELRARETFFRSVFQAIPYPTAVWRHIGNNRFVLHFYNSSAMEATLGRMGEIEGIELTDYYAHAPEFAARVRESFITGLPVVAEQRYRFRTTGAERYVRITSAKVGRDFVIDSITDLTDLKAAQEALAENEARFRRLLDNAPDVIYRLALKPELRYEYISPAATAVTGCTPEALMADLSFAGTQIFPGDHREPASIEDLPEVGPIHTLRWIRKDGQTIWLEHRYVIVRDAAGEPIAIEGISRDVTTEVEARRVLEQSLSEKEMLLQEVHHRVKNNLAILSSLLELQAATLPDNNLREILRDTQNRLLSVARVHEALYRTGEESGVDLGSYVTRLGAELREAYQGQGIELEYDLPRYVVSPRRAIHLGLMVNELISNAFKHAFPASLSRSGRVLLRLSDEDEFLRLEVQDNGIGLPEDFARNRVDSLGIQVVEMLVDQMNGRTTYASEPGHGTRICVEIPQSELAIENGPA